MIVGRVNVDIELVIQVEVLDHASQVQGFEAILDTGFNGALTLPAITIAALGLPLRTQSVAVLADGSVQRFEVHAATVLWNGQRRGILVHSIDADPLMGTAMIVGHDLKAHVVDGGRVEIEAIP